MNIYGKLQKVSVELQETSLKKSGHNKFAGFKYFELGDFLPTVNKLFLDNGLNGFVTFDSNLATLVINDNETDEQIQITSPMVEINMKGANAIQNLGAVQTYQRRYLYMAALGIVENDVVDSQDMKETVKPKLATDKQVNLIMELIGNDLERGQKILSHYKVNSYNELTINQASQCLKQIQK